MSVSKEKFKSVVGEKKEIQVVRGITDADERVKRKIQERGRREKRKPVL